MTQYNHKTVSTLLNRYQRHILSSRFQNCEYNGQPLYEYFGVPQVSTKEAPKFSELLDDLLSRVIPQFNTKWLEDEEKLKEIDNLYVSQYFGFIKIKDLLSLAEGNEYLIECYPPSFFSRAYKPKFYNKETQETRIGYVSIEDKTPLIEKYRLMRVWAETICQEELDFEAYRKLSQK